jgi:mono/diheme cytochrome c family protein
MPCRYITILYLLLLTCVQADPRLLSPVQIKKDLGASIRDITVIEPHEQCMERECLVGYRGIPLRTLLEYYYPKEWAGFDGDILLSTLDGYLGIVEASKARNMDAYLVFGRADGKPFRVDSYRQNQSDVPLCPFYLVWDNQNDAELLQEGGYGWPYQVYQIELVSGAIYSRLIPPGASASAQKGFVAFKTYCLNCHNIQGIGGRKVQADMKQLVTGKTRNELQSWIDNPGKIRYGTTMPPFNDKLQGEERSQLIDQIVDYLEML